VVDEAQRIKMRILPFLRTIKRFPPAVAPLPLTGTPIGEIVPYDALSILGSLPALPVRPPSGNGSRVAPARYRWWQLPPRPLRRCCLTRRAKTVVSLSLA